MGESVAVEVTVFNRAGRDIILDGPGDQSWLAINLTNPAGQLISKVKSKKREKAVIVRAGEALKRKIRVNDYVEFDDYGNYGLTASVYFPEKRSFFASKRLRISITDGQVFWEQVVGVPQGTPGAGSYRKYQLMTYNSTERTELYARIRDDTGNFDYGTFSLGTIILYRDPQVTVDGENKLHALYMAAPRTYRHVIIDTRRKNNFSKNLRRRRLQSTAHACLAAWWGQYPWGLSQGFDHDAITARRRAKKAVDQKHFRTAHPRPVRR